jgi:hypothetical protein
VAGGRARVAGDGGRARGGGARGWVGGLTARGSGRTVGVNSSRDSRKARTSSSLMPSIPGTSGRVLGGLASSPGGGAVGASAAPGASVDVIEREGRTREDAEARRGKWRARKRGWRTSRARRKAMVIEISRGIAQFYQCRISRHGQSRRAPRLAGSPTSRVRSFRRPHNRAARRGERTSERSATDRPTRTGRTVMACAASSVARALAPRLASARAARAAAAPGEPSSRGTTSAAASRRLGRTTARPRVGAPGVAAGAIAGGEGKHLDDVRPRPRPRPLARARSPARPPPAPIAPSTWNWAKSARRPLFRH